jgi:hypothetical protein
MCAQPSMSVFCSLLMLRFPGTSLRYFRNDLEMVSVAPIISGITFVSKFHVRRISIVKAFVF